MRGQGGRQLPAEVAAGWLQLLSSEAAAAKAKVSADKIVLAEAAADCWNPGSWPRRPLAAVTIE